MWVSPSSGIQSNDAVRFLGYTCAPEIHERILCRNEVKIRPSRDNPRPEFKRLPSYISYYLLDSLWIFTIKPCSGKRVRSSNTNHNVVKNQSCPSRRVAYSISYRWRCSGNTKDVPWSCRTCKHIWLQSPSNQESDIGISNKAPVAGQVAFTLPSHNVRCRPEFHIFPSTRSKRVQCKPVKLSSNLSVARKEGKHVALQWPCSQWRAAKTNMIISIPQQTMTIDTWVTRTITPRTIMWLQ